VKKRPSRSLLYLLLLDPNRIIDIFSFVGLDLTKRVRQDGGIPRSPTLAWALASDEAATTEDIVAQTEIRSSPDPDRMCILVFILYRIVGHCHRDAAVRSKGRRRRRPSSSSSFVISRYAVEGQTLSVGYNCNRISDIFPKKCEIR